MKKFNDSFNDYYREGEIYDVRLPLMCNMLKYCHRDVDVYGHKNYDIEIDHNTNTVKLMLTPLDSTEVAYIKLVGAIERDDQMHEMQDYYDMTYFNFIRMTPIEARYHRDNEDLRGHTGHHVEMLSDKELRDPYLLLLIDSIFDGAMYMQTVDKVTGRKEVVHELTISKAYHELNKAD